MNVDIVVVLEFSHELLGVLKGELERVRIGPGKVCRICFFVEISEGVRELDLEVAFVIPRKWPLASSPLLGGGGDAVDRAEAHLVELSLGSHTFDVESQGLTAFDTFHAEVKPGMVVASGSVRQGITRHVAGERVGGSIFSWIALTQVTRVKFAGYNDSTRQIEGVLLGLALVHENVSCEFIGLVTFLFASLFLTSINLLLEFFCFSHLRIVSFFLVFVRHR